jgi:lysozyme
MWLVNLLFSLFKNKVDNAASPMAAESTPVQPVSAQPAPVDNRRHINKAGIDLIKSFEGCRLEAYPDPATGGDPWTVGYGSTGPKVVKGLKITQQQAEELLLEDLERFEKGVSNLVTVNISDNQFAALVSFSFNCGLANLKSSTLLKLVNAGKFEEAALQFERWNKAAGKVMTGLTRRRQAERDLFLRA